MGMKALGAVFASAVIGLALVPSAATAAHPCGRQAVGGGYQARVATWKVNCETGWEVTQEYFRQVRTGESDSSPPTLYRIPPFQCVGLLAGSQMDCKDGTRRIFASTNPDDFPANWYPPRPKLGSRRAASLMRHALEGSRFAFEAGYARQVRCNHRLSRVRRRCRISWIVGDIYVSGRGVVWISPERGIAGAGYSYRLAALNAYCVSAGRHHCTARERERGRL